MANSLFTRLVFWAGLLLIAACSEPTGTHPERDSPPHGQSIADWQGSLTTAAVNAVTALSNETRQFAAEPNAANQQRLQAAWVSAHTAWLRASFLFPTGSKIYQSIDSYPFQPGFVDSLPDYPHSGIVNDMTLPLTSETLRLQHQITDDSEVALGLHVLEYYAFSRPIKDFSKRSKRRQQFLNLVADLLLLDLLEFSRTDFLPDSRVTLTRRVQEKTDSIYDDLKLFEIHGWSNESFAMTIKTQIQVLDEILNEGPGLNYFLIGIDGEATRTLNQSIDELLQLVAEESELKEGELLLRLGSISRQLQHLLKRASETPR